MSAHKIPLLSSRGYIGAARLVPVLDNIHSKLGARAKKSSGRKRKAEREAKAAAASAAAAARKTSSSGVAAAGPAVLCQTCSAAFPSRNAMFRHLKRLDILCGKPEGYSIVAAKATAALAAEKAAAAAAARSVKPKVGKSKRVERKAPLISVAAVSLWFGDIPQAFASNKRISEVLYNNMPRGMPMPYVKRVVKKGYREGSRRPTAADDETSNDKDKPSAPALVTAPAPAPSPEPIPTPPAQTPAPADAGDGVGNGLSSAAPAAITTAVGDKFQAAQTQAQAQDLSDCRGQAPWLGYAFVLFRDAAEAVQATAAFNGLDVGGGWVIRIMPGIERKGSTPRRKAAGLAASADPSLGHQLFPTSLRPNEQSDAIVRHCNAVGIAYGSENDERELVQEIKAHYRRNPRQVMRAGGVSVSPALLDPLLTELQQTRWPAVDHRAGMECSHYLVLYLGRPNPGYEALATVVGNLLSWADHAYPCTMVAVTKNFEGSPHIDARDVTYQYAISLGSFTSGGELCVESSEDPSCVHVLTTHNKIARIDGRFIHWVRGHSGGDRYSVIYYSTNEAHATPPTLAFDPQFAPQGSSASGER